MNTQTDGLSWIMSGMSGKLRIIIITLMLLLATPVMGKQSIRLTHAFFEPFIWKDGSITRGLYVDILNEALTKRLGYEVLYFSYPWKRAQKLVRTGLFDGFVSIVTPDRAQYTTSGDVPLVTAELGLFTYTNHPKLDAIRNIRRFDDLKSYHLMSYLGDQWSQESFADYSLFLGGGDLKAVLKQLAFRRGDLVIHPREVVWYNVKKLGLGDKIVNIPEVNFKDLRFKLLISKKSEHKALVLLLDAVLKDLHREGFIDAAKAAYR